MTSITITHTVDRDDEPIELECTGRFYREGRSWKLDEWDYKADQANVNLTLSEMAAIEEALTDAQNDDYDESRNERD